MRLILEAISGRDVLHVRSIGRQDNYVVLTAAGEAAMTQPDWGSGSAPDWGKLDEGAGRIEIALPRGSDGAAAPILVQVMSKNRFAADAVAGTATLDLAAVALAELAALAFGSGDSSGAAAVALPRQLLQNQSPSGSTASLRSSGTHLMWNALGHASQHTMSPPSPHFAQRS